MNTESNLQDDTIDLKELFFTLIAQWKLIILCTFFTFICAILYLRSSDAIYQTDALVQIKSNSTSPLAKLSSEMAAMASFAGLGGAGGNSTQSEIELLKSRAIFGQAIQNLNLDLSIHPQENILHKVFYNDESSLDYNQKGIIFSSNTNNNQLKFTQFITPKEYENKTLVLKINNDQYSIFDEETNNLLIKGELNHILNHTGWKINISGSVVSEQIFNIQKHSLPAAMSKVLNDFNVEEKGKGTGILELTYQGINKTNIPEVLNTVLNIYKAQDIDRSVADKNQQVAFLEKQLPELKNDLDNSERQFNQFREKFGTIDVKEESELYLKQSMELETQKILLQQKQAELSAQYTSEHPAMQAIGAQLATISSKITEINGKVKKLPEIQRLYLQYYRDVEIKNKLYTNLLGTYQTLNVAKAGELGKVDIIDFAVEPVKPIKPRKLIVLIASILVGGFIGVFIALLRNLMNTGIRNLSLIVREHDIKNFGEISQSDQLNSKSKNYLPTLAINHPTEKIVEQIRQAANAIYSTTQLKQKPIFQIIGTSKNIGTTTLAANISIVLAQLNLKVVLVDTNLRNGHLHEYFNINNQAGLSDYLESKVESNTIIVPTQQINLDIIICGNKVPNPISTLSNDKLTTLLETLTQKYDLVILNSSPIIDFSDSVILAKHIDTHVLVSHSSLTTTNELEKALEYFKNSGFKFDGVILNGVPKIPFLV
ncbi:MULTISPECIES: polysaccharide biosynthesis tyrosine autokinase [unclassified Acinetobacter]|uniref:polysaccharide biosynthesis tyrosine autokinase n=1 Tax=unclassified Acinetobacter TaxID=196816 RepID=UPI0015D2DAC6|nr:MULTISPECIES: polysaccharide biosynthesis tyrosine autokinase [unclassified Acinetobacter]